jgi:hypothetical protein
MQWKKLLSITLHQSQASGSEKRNTKSRSNIKDKQVKVEEEHRNSKNGRRMHFGGEATSAMVIGPNVTELQGRRAVKGSFICDYRTISV